MTKDVLAAPIDKTPTVADKALIRAMLRPGRDQDLPETERSTRAKVSNAVDYTAGTQRSSLKASWLRYSGLVAVTAGFTAPGAKKGPCPRKCSCGPGWTPEGCR